MGYTHYWTWWKDPSDVVLSGAVRDMTKIIEETKGILAGPDGEGKPITRSHYVSFNGKGEDAYETFEFPGSLERRELWGGKRGALNFTKTARKPYDKVVVACLLAARAHIPETVLEISSDGNWDDWKEGRDLYRRVIGIEPMRPSDVRATTEGTVVAGAPERALTPDEIEKLASRRGVRRIAVENFLGTLPLEIGYEGNMTNLYQDAAAYRWNSATVDAIAKGIRMAYGMSAPDDVGITARDVAVLGLALAGVLGIPMLIARFASKK